MVTELRAVLEGDVSVLVDHLLQLGIQGLERNRRRKAVLVGAPLSLWVWTQELQISGCPEAFNEMEHL